MPAINITNNELFCLFKLIKFEISKGYHHKVAKLQTRADVVHLNFWAGSTFPVPICTLHWVNKADNQ